MTHFSKRIIPKILKKSILSFASLFVIILFMTGTTNSHAQTVGCVDESQIDLGIICPAIFDPVCGCDGITYGNSCEAFNYGGVSEWTSGPCPPPCVDESQIDLTILCPSIFDPVCGCDDVTYNNSCEAFNYGGVTEWTAGPCVTETCPVPTGLNATVSPSGTKASLTWDNVPGAALYKLQGRVAGTTIYTALTTPNNFKIVGSLTPGTTYEWRARALCESGEVSDYSELSEFTTGGVGKFSMRETMLTIYPNPNNGSFNLLFKDAEGSSELMIKNVLGQVVYKEQLTSSNDHQINMSELNPGLYFIDLINNGTIYTSNFIIE